MHSPAPDIVAGYSSGCVADKDANPETNLGSTYSPVDYMSITSFPRLPEEDVLSAENTAKSRKDDDNVLSEQDTGQIRIYNESSLFTNITLDHRFFVSLRHLSVSAVYILLQSISTTYKCRPYMIYFMTYGINWSGCNLWSGFTERYRTPFVTSKLQPEMDKYTIQYTPNIK